jgi:hypothetical protein
LRIWSEHRAAEEVAAIMGQPSESRRPGGPWWVDLPGDRDARLDDQLPDIQRFLEERSSKLETLADAYIDLRISWTPHDVRDGVVLTPYLLALFDRLRCIFVLDTSLVDDREGTSWRVSLRIQGRPTADIAAVLGEPSTAPADEAWTVEIPADGPVRLVDQFPQVLRFLQDRLDVLEGLEDCEITVAIEWTPRDPQDGITIDLDLLAVLARIRARFRLQMIIE